MKLAVNLKLLQSFLDIGDAGKQTRAPSSELFENHWGGRERHQIGENIF